ncbi:MAG TPA: hypothetical protein VGT24_00710 [Candidatus Acidoferrales bacterium]|nr:hypothetical protein [Candidatus Acidoferrales bacterium]
MQRDLTLLAACALVLAVCAPGHAQDAAAPSPSLGDIARQAQKDKANKPAAKVLTNDDLSSSTGPGTASLGAGFGQIAPSAGGKSGASLSPAEKLAMLETVLDKLDTVDRLTLARNVLGSKDVDFPGRDRWEEKLFSAKQAYVVQGRELVQRARQIIDSADSLKGNQDPNEPRVKEMSVRLQALIHDAVRMDASFQAMMIEGRDLASQASSH